MDKKEVLETFARHRKIAKAMGAQYDNNIKAIEFYNGDTMSYEDRIQFVDDLGNRRRALVQFNKVQPNVDSVCGFMAQNRRQAKALARLSTSANQQLYSKNANALYDYHRENENADQLETEQDLDMLICGVGGTDTDLSYIVGNATTDPNGEILKAKIDVNKLYWHPATTDKNLLSSPFAGYFEEYDLKEALDLFQDSSEEDFEMVGDSSDQSGYEYYPYGGTFDKIRMEDSIEWVSKEENRVKVYNHQWMVYETFYRAENPIYTASTPEDALFAKAKLDYIQSLSEEGEYNIDGIAYSDMFKFNPSDEELTFDEKGKKLLIEQFGDMIKPIAFKRKCFYTAIISNKHVFKFFKNISQQGFSIKFKTGTYNASKKIWTGMVNAMMEPAEYHNKALTELMFTIAANSKGGVMIEEDAVEDVSVFEDKWAQTDAVIVVRSGAIAAGKIQEKTRAAVPTGLENIITLTSASIAENGVDPAFLGKVPDGQESGILYKRRIRQIISKMARYFDSVTLYQKEDLRLHLDLIAIWIENNNGQWMRITGEDGSEDYVQISKDMMAAEYDVTIQEAAQTPEDKQEVALTIKTMADAVMMTDPIKGMALYAVSMSLLPIDGDVLNTVNKILKPDQQTVPIQEVQKLQQVIEQLQSQITQVQTEKTMSEAEKNRAMTQKTLSEIPKVHADSAKSLEEARRTAYENDILQSSETKTVNVNI